MTTFGASAMDVVCPLCKAEIGVECSPTTSYSIKGQPHVQRTEISQEYAVYQSRLRGESRLRGDAQSEPAQCTQPGPGSPVCVQPGCPLHRPMDLKLAVERVNHPAHYGGRDDPYEAIKVIEAWQLGFNLGNTVKYISRAERKGAPLEDLKKAAWYLAREIRNRERP